MTSERDQRQSAARGDTARDAARTDRAPWLVELLYDELPASERGSALAIVAADAELTATLRAYERIRAGASELQSVPLPAGTLARALAAAAARARRAGTWWGAIARWWRATAPGPALVSALGAALVALIAVQVAPGPGRDHEAQRLWSTPTPPARTLRDRAAEAAPTLPDEHEPAPAGDMGYAATDGDPGAEEGPIQAARTPTVAASRAPAEDRATVAGVAKAKADMVAEAPARRPLAVRGLAPGETWEGASDQGLAEAPAERAVAGLAPTATAPTERLAATEAAEKRAATARREARWQELRRRLANDELAAAERLLHVIVGAEGESAATRRAAAALARAKASPLPMKATGAGAVTE